MTMKNSSNEQQKFPNGFKFIMFPSHCDLCFYKYVNDEMRRTSSQSYRQTLKRVGWPVFTIGPILDMDICPHRMLIATCHQGKVVRVWSYARLICEIVCL